VRLKAIYEKDGRYAMGLVLARSHAATSISARLNLASAHYNYRNQIAPCGVRLLPISQATQLTATVALGCVLWFSMAQV
jgi:hypothetical protein